MEKFTEQLMVVLGTISCIVRVSGHKLAKKLDDDMKRLLGLYAEVHEDATPTTPPTTTGTDHTT